MTFMSAVANAFRSAPKVDDKKIDRYNVLSPVLATNDFVQTTKDAISTLKGSMYSDLVIGRKSTSHPKVQIAVKVYHDYVKRLSSSLQAMERANPFSSFTDVLETVRANLIEVQDNFHTMFGQVTDDAPEVSLKSSALVAIGYLERADNYCTWISSFIEHLTADDNDMISPYRTREFTTQTDQMSEFANLNTGKWNIKSGGLFKEIKAMQMKGVDLPLKTNSGEWIDEYTHDSQFNPDEQSLITASLRSPVSWVMTRNFVRAQQKIELATAKKEWLTSKMIQVQTKMRGLDENSQEYRKLKKSTETYANLVSRYEQQIERIRG